MKLQSLVQGILRQQAASYGQFAIDPGHVINTGMPTTDRFAPQRTYFEIRLRQMHLRDQREYWQSFLPLASISSEFLHAGARREVPVVVGPERLENAPRISNGDRVEFLNTRVAGPYPYEGDDVSLFVGLFRIQTNNWAKRALSLLERVAEAFDPSKLTSYLNITGPLVDGVEGLLGMDEVQWRMGLQKAYKTPPDTTTAGPLPPDVLRPAFEVLIRAPSNTFDRAERDKFWVNEGRLFYGDSQASLQEYRAADFLLVEIAPLAMRPDCTTFDFHKIHWRTVQERIWSGDEEAANQAFKIMTVHLVQCQDIILPHRRALQTMYKQEFETEVQAYKVQFDPSYVPPADGRRAATVAGPRVITEGEMLRVMEGGMTDASATAPARPEDLLAALDR